MSNQTFQQWLDEPMRTNWQDALTEREQKEITFCQLYARDFAHGTVGHNEKLIIAKLATMCDGLTRLVERTEAQRMELIMKDTK